MPTKKTNVTYYAQAEGLYNGIWREMDDRKKLKAKSEKAAKTEMKKLYSSLVIRWRLIAK